jgi:hypothetical protein
VVAGGAIVLLVVVETLTALTARWRVPSEADWQRAAAEVRGGFRGGDLIVAAPGWADPLMRQQLGDLVPMPVAGRMDAARFGRIWQISQRGGEAPETKGLQRAVQARHGALTVSRFDKRAAQVTFDFVAGWAKGSLSRIEPDGRVVACSAAGDGHHCVGPGYFTPQILEIDTSPRFALHSEPVGRATLALDYDNVPMGRELAVGAGLHNVWKRKGGNGTVKVRVLVNGQDLGSVSAANFSGWTVRAFDTTALAGQTAKVRFEITADNPVSRHLGLAAEARN